MPDPEPKPEPSDTDKDVAIEQLKKRLAEIEKNEPKTFTVVNQSSSLPAWLSLAGFVLLAGSLWWTNAVNPTPGPTTPVTIEKPAEPPAKPTIADSIAKRNGIRNDASKEPLVKLIESGTASYTLHFQPDGKPEIVWTVTVTGGERPAPVKPVTPVDPDKPLPPAPVDPDTKVTSAVYVFEKDQGGVPAAVMSGMNRLNREKKIVATVYEQDSKDGTGDTPDQYKVPLEEAKKAGLPALVLMADKTFLKVVKAPKTEAEVVEAIK